MNYKSKTQLNDQVPFFSYHRPTKKNPPVYIQARQKPSHTNLNPEQCLNHHVSAPSDIFNFANKCRQWRCS